MNQTLSVSLFSLATTIFLGVSSEIANIVKLVLSSSEPERAIAINQLSFVTVTTDIPEPISTGSLLSLGLLGFGVKSKKKYQS